MLDAATIITVIFLAASLAALYTYYNKRIVGDFLRALDEHGASSIETAVGISEVEGSRVRAVLIALSLGEGSVLRRFVGCDVEETSGLGAILKAGYYLIPERRETALSRYEGKGLKLVTVAVCIAIMAVFAIAASILMPYISQYLGLNDSGYVPDDAIDEIVESAPEDGTEKADTNTGAEDGQPTESGSRFEIAA